MIFGPTNYEPKFGEHWEFDWIELDRELCEAQYEVDWCEKLFSKCFARPMNNCIFYDENWQLDEWMTCGLWCPTGTAVDDESETGSTDVPNSDRITNDTDGESNDAESTPAPTPVCTASVSEEFSLSSSTTSEEVSEREVSTDVRPEGLTECRQPAQVEHFATSSTSPSKTLRGWSTSKTAIKRGKKKRRTWRPLALHAPINVDADSLGVPDPVFSGNDDADAVASGKLSYPVARCDRFILM